jgi:multidrug efflux system membrane fusion protein
MAISKSQHDSASPTSLEGLPEHQGTARSRSRGWLWFLVLVLLAGGGYYYYSHSRASSDTTTAPATDGGGRGPGGRGGRGGGGGAVPVAVTAALKQDVPYYISGLGSVTPFNTVTVKTRIDGQLQKVYFQEGQFVHEGDLLAQIDPRPYQVALEQMQGQLARDQAQLKDARTDLARYDELHKEGVIAQQQVDTQTATVGQLEGAIRADQAQIDNQMLQLDYTKITAPLSGRVGLRLVDQGNMVHAADPSGLVVITQVQPIAVLFTVPEDRLQEVIKHMAGEALAVQANSRDDQTKLAAGKLATIDNQIDPTTGTVKLKAVFDNHDLSLWPNQFVNVRLMLDVRKNAIVIPVAAVQTGTQGTYVYTVKNRKAALQPVTVDVTQGNVSLIASGVMPGDQVVVDGQDKLQAGTNVDAHAANADGTTDATASSSADGSKGDGGRGGQRGGGLRGGGGQRNGADDPSGQGRRGGPGRGRDKGGPPAAD